MGWVVVASSKKIVSASILNDFTHLHKGAFVKDDNLLYSARSAAHLL